MPTRMEGVFIPVELDTSKAERQLDALERDVNKTADKMNKAATSKPGLRTPSGTIPGSGPFKPAGSPKEPDIADGLYTDFQRLMRLDRMRKFGALRIDAANKAASISGKLESFAETAIGEGVLGAAKFAGAIYAGTSIASKAAPLALEAGRAAVNLSPNDPNFKAVQQQLDNLRNSVSYIESYVKSAVTGIGKTYDMATAMARVNGKVPNIITTYGIYKEADMVEDMLHKRFEYFKSQEIAEAVGRSMADLFKGGINR